MDSPAEMYTQGKWNAVAPVSTCLGMLVEGVGSYIQRDIYFKEMFVHFGQFNLLHSRHEMLVSQFSSVFYLLTILRSSKVAVYHNVAERYT